MSSQNVKRYSNNGKRHVDTAINEPLNRNNIRPVPPYYPPPYLPYAPYYPPYYYENNPWWLILPYIFR